MSVVAIQAIIRPKLIGIANLTEHALPVLTRLRDGREVLCSDLLQLPLEEWKQILCEVFLGSNIPSDLPKSGQAFLQ